MRSGPVPSLPIRLSVSGRSHWGSVCARWSGRRRAWGERIFSRGMLGDRFLGYQRVGRPVRIGARICCPDGGKTPRNGVEKATLGAICYVVIPIRKSAPVLSRTRAPLRWDSRHPKGRRIHLHSSARGSLRGVTSDSSYGVAEHGADGPARRSSSVGRTWWTGPPPSSFAAGCRGPRQDGQAAKTKLLPRSCLRFWTRAWGQRELADERTGRLKKPRSIAGFVQGWAGHPSHPRPIQLTSQGTPDLDV